MDLLYLHFILNFYQENPMVTKQELVNGYETESSTNATAWKLVVGSAYFIIASIGGIDLSLSTKFPSNLDPQDFTSLGWNLMVFWIWHLPRADQSSKGDDDFNQNWQF